ncbi:alpha/beta hydrolase [Aliiglaciecola sp. CAU 1673]|uniref:alpha/beta hydrolase n=1 Tax=Aliiglaciecola sp. CAU 1673 TaxID=3032595 RepID=UPI0023DC153A|nr:alpha/beta hydrolase [Aliiglaciecola sp. CAU 1673]MDF2178651.1 alpha/beta hydrolase [Aliiglaciecola sp. CAU 1673]
MSRILVTFFLGLYALTLSAQEQAFEFVADSGEKVSAYRGELQVPEFRGDENSRLIPLRYVRFAATTDKPGAPIVYLAGGPGGSAVAAAKWRRFPLFMALREFGDVIALEQRGTGDSNILPECQPDQELPHQQGFTDEQFIQQYRQAFAGCLTFWREQGVDVRGYNTNESVADLDALRQHLGAQKLSLWGISYGTHLALAAVKLMPEKLDKIILASVEGLDQTIKLPAQTDAYFARLQQAIDGNEQLKAQFPDVQALMRRVHDKLEKSPQLLNLADEQQPAQPFMLQRRDMQRLASAMVADPAWVLQLLKLYQAADHGVYAPVSQVIRRYYKPAESLKFSPMSTLMDVASGIDEKRKAQVSEQAETALLKDYLNPSLFLDGVAPELDLGNDFRTNPKAEIPALVLSGTLDGRTYIDSQREAVRGLSNKVEVTVVNGGHNLFMISPKVTETIKAFMAGKTLSETRIDVPFPVAMP